MKQILIILIIAIAIFGKKAYCQGQTMKLESYINTDTMSLDSASFIETLRTKPSVWFNFHKYDPDIKLKGNDCFFFNKNESFNSPKEYGTMYLLAMYSEYEKECFADADTSYYWEYSDGISSWIEFGNKGEKNIFGKTIPMHINYRERTFEGFIEFLRRKSKEK